MTQFTQHTRQPVETLSAQPLADAGPNTGDRIRQVTVAVCMVAAVAGSLVGSGALGGTPIAEAAGGALGADATLIAPAVPAFSIWSVIYLGLVAYTVWQFLPAQAASGRQRRLGYPIAASLVLNAAWILSIQAGWLAFSVVVIVALLAVLAWIFVLYRRTPGSGVVEAVVVDGVMGLYLGWVCVATAANITSWLTAIGFSGWGIPATAWAIAVVAVAGLVGIGLAVAGRGRLAPAVSLCWGLTWLAHARLSGELLSTPTAITAIIAVAAVLAATILWRLRAQQVTA
ncbi:tryptophan-rich sensory protein [Homoserinimonas sp. OAct 916]|uniref:tryptophan-rich sensory protein n=1 Tax=Homoserinimonas sp. OAct 916 TaxID=2211450 RepID=UPI0034CE8314